MNKFKRAIESARLCKKANCGKMEGLSSKMNKLIGLTQDELKEAEHEDVSFNVPGYSIGIRSFPWNGWRPILVVAPAQVSCDKVGYANCDEEKFFPTTWDVENKGTDSTWFPDDNEIPKILEAIKASI
jgi:hypothetical protein